MERFQNRTPDLALLRAPDVTGFVIRHAHQLSPVRAGIMVTALRSFFRYLLHRGAIATDLAGCVPAVPNWSLSTLPRFLPTAVVEKLLKRYDRKSTVGRRNHVILMLLARLGLRAGEVIKLSLDDIDWDSGQITFMERAGDRLNCHCLPTLGRPSPPIYGATARTQRVAGCFFAIGLR